METNTSDLQEGNSIEIWVYPYMVEFPPQIIH